MALPDLNMEQQILAIVGCTQSYEVKKTLIQYCCKTSLQNVDNESCYYVLNLAIKWIVENTDILLVESGKMLLTFLLEKNDGKSFLNKDILLNLVQRNDVQPSCILDILIRLFPHIKDSKTKIEICEFLTSNVILWLKKDNSITFVGCLAHFLMIYTDCLPLKREHLLVINYSFICCLGKSKIPKESKIKIVEYFGQVNSICELLQKIWSEDISKTFIVLSVKECFDILANLEYESTVALSSLTNFIPDDVVNPLIEEASSSSEIPDTVLTLGITRMTQWLVWPKKTKASQWILMFFKCLADSGRKKIIENIILSSIIQVFCRVYMPVIRENNFIVLVNMLMYYLELPTAFHMIVPSIPNLLERLRKEKNEKTSIHVKALGELIYTLMYRFPGYTELYQPLQNSLKDLPRPSIEKMNEWLKCASNTISTTDIGKHQSFTLETLSSLKGSKKTGLVNLGNTCYMNSILQCLLLLKGFRNMLMKSNGSSSRSPITHSLQELFTFLIMSKRESIAPERFVNQSRPPWFPSRTQQDCCEFIHYMIDKLEEEDKSVLQENQTPASVKNIIEEHFKGVLCVTYKCLRCSNESVHKEAFTEVLLAFPTNSEQNMTETTPVVQESSGEVSLKGGNQTRKLTTRVLNDETFESSKENIVETSSNIQKATPMVAPVLVKNDNRPLTYTIHEMLDYFMKPEKLSGINQYFCDECRENSDGERFVQIKELPKYLMLVFKRFSFDVKLQTKPKLLHIVEYPEELTFCDMDGSVHLRPDSQPCVGTTSENTVTDDMDIECQSYSYKLCSVVVHSGRTCEAGHYYSYALDTTRNTTQWYCFNDERTNETTYETFMKREKELLTDTTYILIYQQMTSVNNMQDEAFTAPSEMIQRVQLDNIKYCQERNRFSTPSFPNTGRSRPKDDEDDETPPDNCGSNGSSFSVPGNRFIF